jgi:hypothetical protein
MAQFNGKVLTPQGQILKSKIEENSRLVFFRKMRRSGLIKISVTPIVTLTCQ